MLIKEVKKENRPREKALNHGFLSLSDSELIAIILRSGYQGVSAIDLAEKILAYYPLKHLNKVSIHQLTKIKGIKEAKALDLLASFELSRRIYQEKIFDKDIINSPQALNRWLQKEMGVLLSEHLIVVNLNTKNHVINYKSIFKGTIDMSIVHPREIFRFAIESNAAKIICAHNHPSGDVTPSSQDIYVTKRLKEAGNLLGIELIDHVIVSSQQTYSILSKL